MFCHADECEEGDEDADVWAADPDKTGKIHFPVLTARCCLTAAVLKSEFDTDLSTAVAQN